MVWSDYSGTLRGQTSTIYWSTLKAGILRWWEGKKHLDGNEIPTFNRNNRGREISTAWPIIWSNGGPSVRDKSPPLFCISSSDDWRTFVPRRWSQLKAPSVKRLQLPDAEPQWRTHTVSLTLQFTVMCVLFSLFILSLSLSLCSHTKHLKAISSFLYCHALRTHFPIVWFQS